MEISVVILNWNGREYLEKFLPSITENSYKKAEVIIADNCSSDDSIAFLEQHYPEVKIIKLDKNYGFAGGYNRALQQVSSRYYILLNSDVEVAPDWIDPLRNCVEQGENIAACQPKIKALDNKNLFEHAGAAGGFMDRWGYPFCRGRIFDAVEEDENQYNNSIEVFWASGACLFIRSEAFHQAGGFDERLFAHMEEIDLCWRLQLFGYKIMCAPESQVYHMGGGSLAIYNPRKTFFNFRNNMMILCKNLPRQEAFPVIFARLILDGIAAVKFFLEGNPAHSFAVVRAHFSFYGNIGYCIKNRIKQSRFNSFTELKGVYRGSIVWEYFLKGKRKFSQLFES